ncbi:MAG: cytochrome c biogenesis protein CcsA [Candidatus Heimdallarchaeota archaeon]|nr:MAG: cytochrome c biogenesis protein CcsA [Candidatus Heimdallarchaeota archaeon]
MFYLDLGIFGMDVGMLLLLISLIALLFDIFLVISGKYIEKWEIYSEISLFIGSSAFLVSFIYFSYSIITADYNFIYVSRYVNNDMDFFLRLSAIWSGQAGSFFFWAFLAVILYIVFRALFRDFAHEPIFWRSFVIFALQVAFLVALSILHEPFKLNLGATSDGIGLNPVLMNIWNVIHPSIIFIGYALCIIPMVIGIARISVLEDGKVPNFEGKEKLDNFFEFIISLAWLVLSSGIIIGGYWAYITLGWGGFWAWDPVETASLVPWLFITFYFHGKRFFNKREYFGNYIVSMSYIGTLFATYVTRSGIISSVHTFPLDSTLADILRIFIPENSFIMQIILSVIPNERMFFLFIVLVVNFLLPHIYGFKNREIFHVPLSLNKEDFQASKSRVTALKISFISGILGTYAIILGLIAPVIYNILGYLITFSSEGFGPSISVGKLFYNTVLTVFGGIMLIAQFFCTFYPRLSIKRKTGLAIGGIITGIVFAISGFLYKEGVLSSFLGQGNPILSFLSNFWTTSEKADLVLPLIILGLAGLIAEFINVALKEEKNLIRKTSQIMLHFSFLVIILGAILSINMTSTYEVLLYDGQSETIEGTSLTISILDMDEVVHESGLYLMEYQTFFQISTGTRTIGFGVSRVLIHKRWTDPKNWNHEVTIISDLFADIYIVTAGILENPISGSLIGTILQIKIIPYVNIVWAGCLLLHFAIIPLTIGRLILLRKASSLRKREIEKDLISEEKIEVDGVIYD